MPRPNVLTPELRQEFRSILGPEGVLEAPADLEKYGRDESGLSRPAGRVLLPTETPQIQAILRLANERGFPVTPRGLGSGLAGGALPEEHGVVLSLERMNRILEIDERNLVARVEPGVITRDLRDAASVRGLYYPPDPASLAVSSIGGNAATNAGGPRCLKYGVTRDYVLGLKAVLPDGGLISAGVQTRKGVVGYALAHLLVGSEGTLGVLTELLLKLIPHPPVTAGMAAVFGSMPEAMAAVTGLLTSGHLPCALEFLDHRCLALVGDLLPFSGLPPTASLLYIESDGEESGVAAQMQSMIRACRKMGALDILPASEPAERERIWDVRRQVSLRIHESSEIYIPEDVVVPLGRIAELVAALPELEIEAHGLIYAFGHAGDGNIHLNFTAAGQERRAPLEHCVLKALRKVLSMGGTMSGEHGVGEAKRGFLPLELTSESIQLQRGIKKLFDPNGVLNPSKVFPG